MLFLLVHGIISHLDAFAQLNAEKQRSSSESKSLSGSNKLRTLFTTTDIKNAKKNIKHHTWAKQLKEIIIEKSDEALSILSTDAKIRKWISESTPAGPIACPYCAHKLTTSQGSWTWSHKSPDKVICNTCGHVFPHSDFPETIAYHANWPADEGQEISYVDVLSKASITGTLRGYRLHWVINTSVDLGIAYMLTKERKYADLTKQILLRMAKVFPKYLVHVNNEYIDCDPHYASSNIEHLSADTERNCSVIKATGVRKKDSIHSGYTSASRLGTGGMDGIYIAQIALAYDLIADILTSDEREIIENKVFKEMSHLTLGNTVLDEKSLINRCGLAISGLAIQSDKLIEFGLDGFINSFRPDGTPLREFADPETITLFIYAFRSYSAKKEKHKNFNTRLRQVIHSLLWMWGNVSIPHASPGLRDLASREWNVSANGEANRYSLFMRDPEAGEEYVWPDVIFPYLSRGYIRSGGHGERGTLILDASNSGSQLGLVYWKEGREILSDNHQHNTVIVNGSNQITDGTKSSFSIFAKWKNVKAIQAASNTYHECKMYNRTVVQIEHGDSDYIVDIFRVHGGGKRQYVFHGPNRQYTVSPELELNGLDPVHFFIELGLNKCGKFKLKDVELWKQHSMDDQRGDNMLSRFPRADTMNSLRAGECPPKTTWCRSVWSGAMAISKKRKYVTVETTGDRVNVSLNLGNSNGITGSNTFVGDVGGTYVLTFKVRGRASIRPRMCYWKEDDVTNPNARDYVYPEGDNTTTFDVDSNVWTNYTAVFQIPNVYTMKYGVPTAQWSAEWSVDPTYRFRAIMPGNPNVQRVFHKDDGNNESIPYFYITDNRVDEYTTFVAVYEAHSKDVSDIVHSVDVRDSGTGNVAIRVSTSYGTDYVMSSVEGKIRAYDMSTDAPLAVVRSDGSVNMIGGSVFRHGRVRYRNSHTQWSGEAIGDGNGWITLQSDISIDDIKGQSLHITGEDGIERVYPIMNVTGCHGGLKVYTINEFSIIGNVIWRLQKMVSLYDEGAVSHSLQSGRDIRFLCGMALAAGMVIEGMVLLFQWFKANCMERELEEPLLIPEHAGW